MIMHAESLLTASLCPPATSMADLVPQPGTKAPVIALPAIDGHRVVIGRAPAIPPGETKATAVRLDSVQYKSLVSRSHCQITYDATIGKHRLEDLGSLNGVLVNQRKAVCEWLSDGDEVRLRFDKRRI